jgi:hypothetical protein
MRVRKPNHALDGAEDQQRREQGDEEEGYVSSLRQRDARGRVTPGRDLLGFSGLSQGAIILVESTLQDLTNG